MASRKRADEEVGATDEEVRREARAAATEVRIELGAAGRETRQALREAMDEVRAALVDELGGSRSAGTGGSGNRMTRAERKEMTRELLLDAAIDVFAEKGYHGASLDDIAETAGFTKGAVYSNFTRKADLFRALLEREVGRSEVALTAALEVAPIDLLPEVIAELLWSPDRDHASDTLVVEFWLAAVRDPSLREAFARTHSRLGDVLARKLSAADIRPGLDGSELATILDALATGLLLDQVREPEGGRADLYAKAVRKLIAAEPPRGDQDSG